MFMETDITSMPFKSSMHGHVLESGCNMSVCSCTQSETLFPYKQTFRPIYDISDDANYLTSQSSYALHPQVPHNSISPLHVSELSISQGYSGLSY